MLPEQDRRCLYLRAEGLRYREISTILDMSLGSVSLSLERSLARMLAPRNGEAMANDETHLSDRELLLAADGELPARDAGRVRAHLAACWTCRARTREIEGAISEFVRVYRREPKASLPPPDGPRALLRAQLAQLATKKRIFGIHLFSGESWRFSWAIVAAAFVIGAIGYFISQSWNNRGKHREDGVFVIAVPDPSLTPGATVLVSRGEVCRESNVKNRAVPVSLQLQVFREYGIKSAEPSAYEVDYLITPALGGTDDIHNLWPQPPHSATVWVTTQVKDALEDHLREMVCDGQLDLGTAQREIAMNWIGAYKKYFHTYRPLIRFR